MSSFSPDLKPTEITVIAVLVSLLLLLKPLLNLWFSVGSAWYLPYLIWFGIILISFWLQRLLRKHAI